MIDDMSVDELSEAADAEERETELIEQLQALGGRLQKKAEEQVAAKAMLEQRWLDDLRQVHGQSFEDERTKSAGENRSTIVVNVTRNKCNAAEARLTDLAVPNDQRHWGIKPTPIPELDEGLGDETPVTLPDGQQMTMDQIAKRGNEAAVAAAVAMETEIDDQLIEAKFPGKLRTIIRDMVRMGTGIIKGPIIVGRHRKSWQAIDEQAGVYALEMVSDLRPWVEVVSPWDFFPDMSATTIDEAGFTFERKYLSKKMLRSLLDRPGYLKNQIKELLGENPEESAIGTSYVVELRSISGVDTVAETNRYEVWEYHGPIERDDLEAAGLELPEDELLELSGIVEFCGGRVIRVMLQPMDTGEGIYSVVCWERDNACIFGIGVPMLMRNSDRVMRASWRMIMDNAGLSSGGQVVIDKMKVRPENGRWELSPRKVWVYEDRSQRGNVRDAFAVHEIASHQNELAAIFNMARQLADEETNLPLIAQGEQTSNIIQTARGMSILMASADVVMRKAVKGIDDHIYKPLITRFYDWNMQYSERKDIKGDFEIDARGSDALREDAALEQSLMEIAQLVNDPTYGPHINVRSMLNKIVKSKQLDPDFVLRDEEEVKQIQQQRAQAAQAAQAGQQQPDPVKIKELEIKAQELGLSIQRQQQEREYQTARLQMERELALAKLAIEERMTIAELQAKTGIEVRKADDKRQIEGTKILALQDEMVLKRQMGSGI